jgi:hypothetical protein
VSQGTLIGIDQLVLGATAACDLLDLDGRVAIPTGTSITPQLLNRIKEAGVIGLIAGKPDYVTHHVSAKRPSLDAISARIAEMQRRSGISNPLPANTLDHARKVLHENFCAIAEGRLPDIDVMNALVRRMIHDLELTETAPLPQPRKYTDNLLDRLVDGAVDMSVLMSWHLRKSGNPLDFVASAALGALLHDIGLLFVSRLVIEKNGALSHPEFQEIRRHPYLGTRALSPLGAKLPKVARDIVLLHHEREDGQGYPLRRVGDAVPDMAKLAHIIDSYVALVSHRPHREPFSPHKAIEILLRDSGRSFNRTVLREFVERTGRYPLGSAVVLSNNEVGVVVAQGKGGLFRPVVDVYFSRQHQFSLTARRIDLGLDQLKYVRHVMR